MCVGNFLNVDGLKRFNKQDKRLAGSFKLDTQQVLLAGQDGYVYIMIDFEVSIIYLQLGAPILTNMLHIDLSMDQGWFLFE